MFNGRVRAHRAVPLLVFGLFLAVPVFAAGAWETDSQAYAIRLENPKVRVLDVHLPPGHKVKSHDLRDRLVTIKEAARLRTRSSQGIEKEFEARVGEYGWEKAETFEIENIGKSDYRATFIEIK